MWLVDNMKNLKFRAWDGDKFVNNFTISQNGIAISADTGKEKPDWKLHQYTGINIERCEIYDGDIIEYLVDNELIEEGIVFWSDKYAAWVLGDLSKIHFFLHEVKIVRIIGNIYFGT